MGPAICNRRSFKGSTAEEFYTEIFKKAIANRLTLGSRDF